MRADRRFERGEIDVAFRVGRNFAYCVSAHHRRRGVGAVRRVRHEDLPTAGIAAGIVIGPDHGYARELALGTRHRCEADRRHAGHVLQHFLQFEHAGEKPLAGVVGRGGVACEELRQHGERIAGARIVFHGARAQRIEMGVD
ncbi:hypothetical protein D3C83_10470 [compost metagenome]